jgi:WXG100 family type VII secretion target
MANIAVSYDVMRNQAAAFLRGKEELLEQLRTLNGQVDALVSDGFVTDKASVAFQQDFAEYKASADRVVNFLDDIAQRLNDTAAALQATDEMLASGRA